MCSCAEHQILMIMFLIVLFLSGAAAEFTAVIPANITALSGSCVLIPCVFNIPPPDSPQPNLTLISYGVWIINDPRFGQFPNNVIYNGSKQENTYSMEVIGNLAEWNCTSILNNVTVNHLQRYYFRLENPTYRATARDNYGRVNVADMPPRPTITDPGNLREGVSVSITCSALAPCPKLPPELKWTGPHPTAEVKTLQQNSDQTKTAQLTLNFTTAPSHHGTNITCTASYKLSQETKISEVTVTLNISFPPRNTFASIHQTDPVSVGSNVTLTCTSSANPPVSNFSWIHGIKPVGVGDTLTITVTEADKGCYFCIAANYLGNDSSSGVELQIKAQPINDLLYAIVGGSTAVFLFILVLLAVVCCRRKSSGSANRGERMTASPSEMTLPVGNEETSDPRHAPSHALKVPGEAHTLHNQPVEVQYGEIDFSKLQHKVNRDVESRCAETEYTEVRRGGVKPPTKEVEDLYAQVKKQS